MGYLSTFLARTAPDKRTNSRPVSRLDMALGVALIVSLIIGMAFYEEQMSTAAWIGVGVTVGVCALLFSISREKWTLLLLALVFLAIRFAFAFIAPVPEGKFLFAGCFAACALFAALILKKTRAAAF